MMLNIVSNRLYCLRASFMVSNHNFQRNVPKTDFLTSWLRQQSALPLVVILVLTFGTGVTGSIGTASGFGIGISICSLSQDAGE